jgi:hypothetical protein
MSSRAAGSTKVGLVLGVSGSTLRFPEKVVGAGPSDRRAELRVHHVLTRRDVPVPELSLECRPDFFSGDARHPRLDLEKSFRVVVRPALQLSDLPRSPIDCAIVVFRIRHDLTIPSLHELHNCRYRPGIDIPGYR